MPETSAARRVALSLVALLFCCERDGPSRPDPARRAPPRAVTSSLPAPATDLPSSQPPPRPVPSSLVAYRQRNLELVPRRVPVARLAFGPSRIGQLTHDALVVRDLRDFGVVLRRPVDGPRQLVTLVDGSLLAVGREHVLRVAPRSNRVDELGHATLFADSSLIADARSAQRFWVQHAAPDKLYLYVLGTSTAGNMLPFDQVLSTDGCDGRGLAGLTDGSFACTTPTALRHFWAEGKRLDLPWASPEGVWRLSPANRIDQVWVARQTNKLELYQLSVRAELMGTLEVRDRVLDMATRGTSLALVTVVQRPGEPRQWWLSVLDGEGHERLRQPIPGQEDVSSDHWVAKLLEERSVVLSTDGSRVAVGGPTELAVWDTATGKRVFAAEPKP